MYCLDWVAETNSDPLSIVAITGSTTSIVANLIATGMIAYVARYVTHLTPCVLWRLQMRLNIQNHRGHRRLESESGVKLSGARILALLTESGLIYATIQVCFSFVKIDCIGVTLQMFFSLRS